MSEHEANYDPVAARFKPDPELIARVHNDLLARETERERYLRQQWEAARAATRVAMDALRAVWPLDRDLLTDRDSDALSYALGEIESAYSRLGGLEENILGTAYRLVNTGHITTHENLSEFLG